MRSTRYQIVLGTILLAALTLHLFAPPAWWATRNVTTTGSADDYAVINQGQLKNFMRGAIEEMNASLPGGAGSELNTLLAVWRATSSGADDYATANQGQLKALGKMLRQRMSELGMPAPVLGTSTTLDDDDYVPANLGQAKFVFKIAFNGDSDMDGVNDMWEFASFGSLERDLRLDADADGCSDNQEYQAGTDPLRWSSRPSSQGDVSLVVYSPLQQ